MTDSPGGSQTSTGERAASPNAIERVLDRVPSPIRYAALVIGMLLAMWWAFDPFADSNAAALPDYELLVPATDVDLHEMAEQSVPHLVPVGADPSPFTRGDEVRVVLRANQQYSAPVEVDCFVGQAEQLQNCEPEVAVAPTGIISLWLHDKALGWLQKGDARFWFVVRPPSEPATSAREIESQQLPPSSRALQFDTRWSANSIAAQPAAGDGAIAPTSIEQ